MEWVHESEDLKSKQIVPRRVTKCGWKEAESVELHAFCDASQVAYGVVVYIAYKFKGEQFSEFLIARAKVAPLKKITLPRLELMGALFAARLIKFVVCALQLSDETTLHLWTDSMIVLSWIQGDPSRWKQFVSNRIPEIQSLTDPVCWKHCPGEINPADMLSRGTSAGRIRTSELWWKGPQDIMFQTELQSPLLQKSDYEYLSLMLQSNDPPKAPSVLQMDRWGSYMKATRVVAFVLRWKNKKTGELSCAELQEAKTILMKQCQLEFWNEEYQALSSQKDVPKTSSIAQLGPFIGEDGLLRMTGRLQYSSVDYYTMQPIILPRCHFTLLFVRFIHVELKHGSVDMMLSHLRAFVWIVSARRLCKKVRKECFSCRSLDAKPIAQPVAPLNVNRVLRSPPFSIIGIDHAGPLYCADTGTRKFYVLLATCAVVRAAHLEVVSSVGAVDTVAALRRLMGRRGRATVICSDNARGFVLASKLLMESMGSESPEWRFIIPRAPWWGGWWEILVKGVKSALKRSVGTRELTLEELQTTLIEIESCLNSRPLTFVGDTPDACEALTPAHFLIERSSFSLKEPELLFKCPVINAEVLQNKLGVRSGVLRKFWQRWQKEYILSLPQCSQTTVRSQVQEGTLVLIRDDCSKRLSWPLGVIVKVQLGRDGVPRSAHIKTSKGVFVRPVQRLHVLEMPSEDLTSP